jgi:hypothetical protein
MADSVKEGKVQRTKEDNINIPSYRCEVNTKERRDSVGKQMGFCWETGGILRVWGRIQLDLG